MFDKDFYLNLVNLEYRNELEKPIKKSQLKGGGARMTEAFSRSFESIVQTAKPKFDPTRPARYFAENSASLAEEISATTLASFEKMFKTFNAFCAP
jgi:hypothetical protein